MAADETDQMLDATESLDSDEVGERAGDDGVEPPEGWSEANKFGTTANEALVGESLDQKLAEERPDPAVDDLDEPIDPDSDLAGDVEP